MKKLMIGLLSIGLSYGMKSNLTGYNQLNLHFKDGSESPEYFAREENNFPLHGSEHEENRFPLSDFEDGEGDFLFVTPWRKNRDWNVSDMICGEAQPLQKSRIEEAPQEPQEEESFSSTSKRLVAINLDNAEQEVRKAITDSNFYDLEGIATRHKILPKSLKARLRRKGLLKKSQRLSHTESKRRLSAALSQVEALRDANKSVVWARIARKFTVHASTLASYCNRIKTSFDDTQLKQ